MAWQDRLMGNTLYDWFTDAERKRFDDLVNSGVINQHNISDFYHGFLKADKREKAFDQAFSKGFGVNVSREWGQIKRGFADPGRGVEAAKDYFEEEQRKYGKVGGVGTGVGKIAWSAATTPVRSWWTIGTGQLGESENPLETLMGAATAIPVFTAGAGLTSAALRQMAKGATIAGKTAKAGRIMSAADKWGRIPRHSAWKWTGRGTEVGDFVTGISEWPLELIGDQTLSLARSLGAAGVNRFRSQEGLVDTVLGIADRIQTDATPQEKIVQASSLINEATLQNIIDNNEAATNMQEARDLLMFAALVKYETNQLEGEADTDAEATAEAQQHDAETGSRTSPRPWDVISTRSRQQMREQSESRAAEMHRQAQAQLEQQSQAEQQQAQQRESDRQFARAHGKDWNIFRNRYIPLYEMLADTPDQAREWMLADFASGTDPVQSLLDEMINEESEGVDIIEESPAIATQRARDRFKDLTDRLYEDMFRKESLRTDDKTGELVSQEVATTRAQEKLRDVLGDDLYNQFYQRSTDDIVADAHAATDAMMEGEDDGTGETQTTTAGQSQTDAETEEGEQAGPVEGEETTEEAATQTAEPEDVAGRAEADATRDTLPEVVGEEDVIRYQKDDSSWEEVPVVYKLIERSSAIASHKLGDNRVSFIRNLIYNWALGIQQREKARFEEVQERAHPEKFNPFLLAERTEGATRGTPTLLESYDAVGGNHRLMLLEMIFDRDSDTKESYLAMLEERLPDFGIDPAELQNFDEPILVRQVVGAIDNPAEFAKATNTSDTAPRTAEDQALQDANALTDEILDMFDFGEVGGSNRRTIADMLANPSEQNQRALVAFIDNLPQGERARYRRGDVRNLSPEARVLFENAILAKLFTTERGRLLLTSKESGTLVPEQNRKALMAALPHLAKFDIFLKLYHEDVQALSISDDVAAAMHYLSHLRGHPNNLKIGQAAAHLDSTQIESDETLTPDSIVIMRAINGITSAGPIANILVGYINTAIENIRASGVAVREQETLFEGAVEYAGPSKTEMLETVIAEVKAPKRKSDESGQTALIGDEEDAERTPDGQEGDGDTTPPVDSGQQPGGGGTRSDTGGGEGLGDQQPGRSDPDADAVGGDGRSGTGTDDASTTPADTSGAAQDGGTSTGQRDGSAGRGSEGEGTDQGGDQTEPDESDGGSASVDATSRRVDRLRKRRQAKKGEETPAETPDETKDKVSLTQLLNSTAFRSHEPQGRHAIVLENGWYIVHNNKSGEEAGLQLIQAGRENPTIPREEMEELGLTHETIGFVDAISDTRRDAYNFPPGGGAYGSVSRMGQIEDILMRLQERYPFKRYILVSESRTEPQAEPETPAEPTDATSRRVDRLRQRRQAQQDKGLATPPTLTQDQIDLLEDWAAVVDEDTIDDLEGKENLDELEQELLATLQAKQGIDSSTDESIEPEEEEQPSEPEIEPETKDVPDSVPIAEDHVSPLHEPTALAAQNHPDVDGVTLNLSDRTREIISEAQLLAVKLMKRSTDMTSEGELEGVFYHMGFLLGDGTGAGKTISGLAFILDQLNDGRKQHLIIGPKQELYTNNYLTDMKKIGGNTRSMFNFGDLKERDRKKKGNGIGFTTYKLMSSRPELKTGKMNNRLSQLLEWLTGKRAPLEILNPGAVSTIRQIKSASADRQSLPTFHELFAMYDTMLAENKTPFEESIPKALKTMLRNPAKHTATKYNKVLKIFRDFENYNRKYMTASMEDFIAASNKFDGVILFDEAHNMRGGNTNARDVGIMLQNVLPAAKVVYMSATPITKVSELQYAPRLGLWGPGTSFENYEAFHREFGGEDLTVKEIIAKDLKGYGRYLRRSLDMSGVKWESREHALTQDEIDTYNDYVAVMRDIKDLIRLWVDRQQFDTKEAGILLGRIMMQFYASQQTFFEQVQTAYKTRAMLPEMVEKLKAGNKVAVQVAKTYQSAQERAEKRAQETGDPVDFSLKNILIDFLMSDSSPVYKYVVGATNKVSLDSDADGNNIVNSASSIRDRDLMIETIKQMPDLPNAPLDMLHQAVQAAGFATAEITGRSHYYVNGKKIKNPSNTDETEKKFRETRDLNFIIISDAGGEGRNLQTMRPDSPIIDYDIDSSWNVVNTIQKFGRFKRTGAAHDPIYVLTTTDSPAAKRKVGALAEKLTSMGALATGQARSQMNLRDAQHQAEAESGEDSSKDEANSYILGRFGKQAMQSLWRFVHASVEGGDAYFIQFMQELGYVDSTGNPKFDLDSNGNLNPSGIPEPKQFLSRLYGVPYKRQAEYAELFFTQLDGQLLAATEQGTLDAGTTQLRTAGAEIARKQTLHTHEESGTTTDIVEVTGQQQLQRNSWEVVEGIRTKKTGFETLAGPFAKYVRNTKTGKVYALFITTEVAGTEEARGITRYKRFGVYGKPDYTTSEQIAGNNWETLLDRETPQEEREAKLAEIQKLWKEAEKTSRKSKPLSRVMITGMLTPIWDRISLRMRDLRVRSVEEFQELLRAAGFRSAEELERSMQIRQIVLADGTPVQGRIIPAAFLEILFNRFGIQIADTDFADMASDAGEETYEIDELGEMLSEHKAYVVLDNGAILQQIDDDTIEVFGFFTDEEVQNIGLTAEGTPTKSTNWSLSSDEYSSRYDTRNASLGRYRLPADKIGDLFAVMPAAMINERAQHGKPLNVTGYTRPAEAAPHPDAGDRIRHYKNFVHLRQLIMPYLANISDNKKWTTGKLAPKNKQNKSVHFYLSDIDKYITIDHGFYQQGPSAISRLIAVGIEGEQHIVENGIPLEVEVGANITAEAIDRSFLQDVIDGNAGALRTGKYGVGATAIKNTRILRVQRELQKDANKGFKPTKGTKPVEKQLAEELGTGTTMREGELPDGQKILVAGYQYKWASKTPQWSIGIRIGSKPEESDTNKAAPGYINFIVSAGTVESAMDNVVKKFQDDKLDSGLSHRWSDFSVIDGAFNIYDNYMRELAEEQQREFDAQQQSEETRAPSVGRSSGSSQSSEDIYALDHEAIASLEEGVQKIVANIGDTEIKRKILGIYGKILAAEQVNLVGREVSSAYEIAVLGQAARNPLLEINWTFYIKDGKIIAHDAFSLNSAQRTRADMTALQQRLKDLKADGFYDLHNHPTAPAAMSGPDISVSHQQKAYFGDQYFGAVVINSGTYARLVYNDDGTYDHQDQLQLKPDDVGWDTTQPFDDDFVKPDDPLYKNLTPEEIQKFASLYPSVNAYDAMFNRLDPKFRQQVVDLSNNNDAPLAIAELGNYLKTHNDMTVIVGMSVTGRITMMSEFSGIPQLADAGKLRQFLYESLDTVGTHIFHVVATGGQPVREALMRELGQRSNSTGLADGIASIWVDGDSVGNVVPLPMVNAIPGQTIKEGREIAYKTRPEGDDTNEQQRDDEGGDTPTGEPADAGDTDMGGQGDVPQDNRPEQDSPTRSATIQAILRGIADGNFSDDGNTLDVVDGDESITVTILDENDFDTAVMHIQREGIEPIELPVPSDTAEAWINGDIAIETAVEETLEDAGESIDDKEADAIVRNIFDRLSQQNKPDKSLPSPYKTVSTQEIIAAKRKLADTYKKKVEEKQKELEQKQRELEETKGTFERKQRKETRVKRRGETGKDVAGTKFGAAIKKEVLTWLQPDKAEGLTLGEKRALRRITNYLNESTPYRFYMAFDAFTRVMGDNATEAAINALTDRMVAHPWARHDVSKKAYAARDYLNKHSEWIGQAFDSVREKINESIYDDNDLARASIEYAKAPLTHQNELAAIRKEISDLNDKISDLTWEIGVLEKRKTQVNVDTGFLADSDGELITRTIEGKTFYLTPVGLPQSMAHTKAEHGIRFRRSEEGSTSEAIWNSQKLIASRHLATSMKSNWDAITDNADFVFLAPSDRAYSTDEGFGFDAELLIRKHGAVVGTADSIQFYDALVQKIVFEELGEQKTSQHIDMLAEAANTGQETFPGALKILQKVKEGIKDAAKGYRVAGDEAIELLRKGQVSEILVPGELTLDDLLYITINNKAYGLVEVTEEKTEEEGIPEIGAKSLPQVYDPSLDVDPADASQVVHIMPNPDDFDAETKDNLRFQRILNTFTDPAAGLRQVLGIKARQAGRLMRKTLSSGFGVLEEMSKTDRDGEDKIGDHIRKNMLKRQFISKSGFGRDAARMLPVLKKMEDYVRKKANPTLGSKVSPQDLAKRGPIRQDVNNKVWRFIENNEAIKDPQLQGIAQELKEVWRELLIEGTQTMIDLTFELNALLGEKIFITDSSGKRVEWYPESFDGFVWDAQTRDFKKNEGTRKNPSWVHYSIEDAHRKANKLYTPHHFKHNRMRNQYKALQEMVETMNMIIKDPDKYRRDKDTLKKVGITHGPTGFEGYQFDPDGTMLFEFDEILQYAMEYWTTKEASVRGLLEYTDAGIRAERYGQGAPAGPLDAEGKIGYYGHLERARETDDRHYVRDVRILLENRRLMWDRIGEFATIGQMSPILGSSPRLELVLEQVRAFRKNDREKALAAVAIALKAGDPTSMFERLPQFGISVDHGLSVQQDWMEREPDDKGKMKRTDRYQELDIARMELTSEVLDTLRTIGFITKNDQGVDVVSGDTVADRQLTVARFFHEFYNTIAQREASVKDMYLSLGHWHNQDPLEFDDAKFWQKISDITTMSTLSWTTAIQNILEIPILAEQTGTLTMLRGLTKMFSKEAREQLLDLSKGLSHAPRFMAETKLAEKFLGSNWSGFSKTDRISRAAGLGVGLVNAQNVIREYVNTTNDRTKARLRRYFEEIQIDVRVIDEMDSGNVDQLLEEAEEIIMSGEATPKFGDKVATVDKLAWTVLQSMHYISDTTFKAYDATSMAPFMLKSSPLTRLFLKYKSWMAQHNAMKYKNFKRAMREMKQGNFRPAWNMIQSAAWSGATYGMLISMYSMLSGSEPPEDRVWKGMLDAQTFGASSVLLHMANRADGNWWVLSRDMMGQAAGPVGSIPSQIAAPIVTGDFDVAGSQVVRRIPVVNVFNRFDGFRILEQGGEPQTTPTRRSGSALPRIE